MHLDYACPDAAAGNAFVVSVAGQSVTATVAGTGLDWSNYRRVRLGRLRVPAGQHRLTVRPDGPVRHALMDLRMIALTAPGAEVPGEQVPAAQAPSWETIEQLTRDLPPGPVEYQRIPEIWRVSVAAGRRNDADELRRVIDISLPKGDEPLRDWQAVVIGGGVINGISDLGIYPGPRIVEIIGEDEQLQQRWRRAIELSAVMADDETVPPPTRYDALRMLGVLPWDEAGEHLVRYLSHENAELQMGAVSGLVDIDSPRATAALIGAMAKLTEANRKLALDGLLRDAARVTALLDALEAKRVDRAVLAPEQVKRLREHENAPLRERAHQVLGGG